ncbi:unnamed protein product [Closterium sp. NIES-53]
MQTQMMRIHEHTSVHKEAMQRQAEIVEAISKGQTNVDRFINADVEGRRAVRLMRSVQFLCQEDASISMFSKLMRHLAERDTPDILKQSYGVYLMSCKEALAVKDAATANLDLAMVDSVVQTLAERLGSSSHWSQRYINKVVGISTDGVSVMIGCDNGLVTRLPEHDAATANPDLAMVDSVVQTLAERLGSSSHWSQRFKYLQRIIYNTNLEVQGIYSVRWLSGGDAVKRLCKVDVTEVAKTAESVTSNLEHMYLDTKAAFGGTGNGWLPKLLALYGKRSGQTARVRGTDAKGRPINHSYILHERPLKGHIFKSGYKYSVRLCRKFAKNCIDRLLFRLDDLRGMGPTKLFHTSKWPKSKHAREHKCQDWVTGCSALFKNKLPRFDLKKVSQELATWCPIMEPHHEEESFAQGVRILRFDA